MAGLVAFEHAQSPQLVEPARRSDGETQSTGQGHNRKLQPDLAYHERMAQQIRLDNALLDGQAERRCENIFKRHPEKSGDQFFV